MVQFDLTVRFLSYNILDGGTGRTAALMSVIAAQSPDVIGLVEAEDAGVVEDLAGRLEMDFIQAPGNYKASALLSRFPIRDSINHGPLQKDLTKSLLEATVVDAGGRAWSVGVLHLHAQALEADEAIREREIEVVLKIFAPHREAGRGHVLMGDFNANSPVQEIDPALCKRSTREAWERNGGGIPRRVIGRVLDAGYIDTFHAVDPGLAATTGTFSTEFPGQRVDYIFSFGIERARLKAARIIYEGDAEEASDHFPVMAEFD